MKNISRSFPDTQASISCLYKIQLYQSQYLAEDISVSTSLFNLTIFPSNFSSSSFIFPISSLFFSEI